MVLRIALVIVLSASAYATDLILLDLHNAEDLRSAQLLFGTAFACIDGSFLVQADADQQKSLDLLRMDYRVAKADALAQDWQVVGFKALDDLDGLRLRIPAACVPIGQVRFLAGRDDPVIGRLLETRQLWSIPLAGRHLPFHANGTSVSLPWTTSDMYPFDSLAQRISQDTIYKYNKRLEDFYTRHSYTDSILKARDWLVQQFTGFGYSDVSTQSFPFPASNYLYTGYNIRCVKPGYAEPNEFVVVGAHYDSYCYPYSQAPGADDDASGVAVTLELARILKDVPLRKSIIFMPFSGEEQWMVGSSAAAQRLANEGSHVEVMFNSDMVGYTVSTPQKIRLYSYPNTVYRTLIEQVALRLTSVVPIPLSPTLGYDEGPFIEHGADGILAIESDFNTPNYHRTTDLCSNLNFSYMTDIARMLAVAVATAADAGSVVRISQIIDHGDGNGLRVRLANPYPGYTYVLFYGANSGNYTDSIPFVPGLDTVSVSGLTADQPYYFAVFGQPAEGTRSLAAREMSETPRVEPRAPGGLHAAGGTDAITLTWGHNAEDDIESYVLFRRLAGQADFDAIVAGITGLEYIDESVAPNVTYEYAIEAIDRDNHRSPMTQPVKACCLAFASGLAIVDETTAQFVLPDEAQQHAFFDSLFDNEYVPQISADGPQPLLDQCELGPYSSLFYFDDDISQKQLYSLENMLRWYLTNPNNLFVCGYRTIQSWALTPVPAEHLLYSDFRVTGYDYTNLDRCIGAHGENGWPDIHIDTTRGLKYLLESPVFTVEPDATVIYTYDSNTDNPRFEGKPCGVVYDTGHGKRLLLGFPLYYMTPSSAAAVIAKCKEYFGITPAYAMPGDVDGSGLIDLQDINLMIAYLSGRNVNPPHINDADVNQSCFVNLADLSLLISFLTLGYPDPQPGCVTP